MTLRVKILVGAWTGLIGTVRPGLFSNGEWHWSTMKNGINVRLSNGRTAIFYPAELELVN